MKRQATASDPSAPAAKKTARTPTAKKATSAAKKTAAASPPNESRADAAVQKSSRAATPARRAAKPAPASPMPAIAEAAQRASDALPADVLRPASEMPREQLVRERAYAFYLARGCADGHEVEDWLRAEAEIAQLLARRGAP